MTTTLAGHPVLSVELTIPRVGLWSALVEVDADVVLSGPVDLVIEARTWRGTVYRGGVELGRGTWRIVGAGALHSALEPQAFRDTTLLEVLRETSRAAGVSLASGLGDLSHACAAWHRRAAPASHAIGEIATAAGFAWRALADGTLWCGADAWDLQVLPGDVVELLDVAPAVGRYELAGVAALDLLPGRTVALDDVGDVRVGLIEHRQRGAALRTVVWSERAGDVGAPADRLRAALVSIVRAELRQVAYLALHPATVVSQDGAGGPVDLRPDSDLIAPPQRVPLRTLPGCSLTVPAGTRVLLAYEHADPRRPVALLSELADVTRLALNGGSHRAAREGHAVRVTFPSGTVLALSTGGTATTTAPVQCDGTITEGSDVLRLP